ncbi:MAG: hypothetical protein K9M11_03700 [Candidatus Pacebacteria bacterium]|nr:hypothetical protein [Candidatus Paceibacterota bacterium]
MDNKSNKEFKAGRGKIIEGARRLAERLNKEIEKGNDTGPFLVALGVAVLKDTMDIVLSFAVVGLVPGVGWAISLFVTTFLFFFMLGKGWFLSTRLRIWFWVLGFFVDGLPVFGDLPISSILVIYAWHLTKKKAEESSVKLKNLNRLTRRDMKRLNQTIHTLELGN